MAKPSQKLRDGAKAESSGPKAESENAGKGDKGGSKSSSWCVRAAGSRSSEQHRSHLGVWAAAEEKATGRAAQKR